MPFKKQSVADVAFLIPLDELRNTPSVDFHYLPLDFVKEINAIDRVEHAVGAFSPVAKNVSVKRPWYMHPNQEDNLLVLNGTREINLYTVKHGKIETFEVSPSLIKHEGEIIFEGPALLGWGTHVFHRVHSPQGSISINFARHFEGFGIDTNFNIYDLNTDTGSFSMIRAGHLDQPVIDIGE